ncbi:hypothetical protein [Brevibacillus laterosporus]|uniref:hypothetical protein n=1 Tax=Brevibacillus laterosporus TaxID=1465 RepID=UPI003D1B4EE2
MTRVQDKKLKAIQLKAQLLSNGGGTEKEIIVRRWSRGLGRLRLQSVYHQKENYQSGKESFHSSSPYLYVSISTVINVIYNKESRLLKFRKRLFLLQTNFKLRRRHNGIQKM